MSWLLRHGAEREGIAMDEQGYINVADLLQWQKMSKELSVTFEEVLEEVKSNVKQRFALLYMPSEITSQVAVVGGETTIGERQNPDLALPDEPQNDPAEKDSKGDATIGSFQSARTTATATALEHAFSASDPDPSQFLIRATQGHSLKTISPSSYLTPIALSDPSSIPSTVVHGTFYAAWNSILRTGGLRPMSRVHVHFATGPNLQSVLDSNEEKKTENREASMGEQKAVISGMRSDAQILIYINVRKALEMGIPFWRSENGVVLSDGVVGNETDAREEENKKVKVVPTECWDVVVEVRKGMGVIWREGELVQELPEHLKKSGWPHRKEKKGVGERAGTWRSEMINGGGGKKKGKGRTGGEKPKLKVERDDDAELG
jgi:2'-phosphotransferase